MSYGVVTVGTAVTLVLDGNANRVSFLISNDGSNNLYLGQDVNVTTANAGVNLTNGSSFSDESNEAGKCWLGTVYGITNTATTSVRYWDKNQ